ncbi:TPA: cell wall-binding protein [Clostridium perfringens]|uniref:L,D-transpeptidase family protein n=1 Tax=Clostridium perfringens TaxID=1502 RepID=UPI001A1D6B55|nr:L,D-transpeptidase family protein [Clostridium perfringens]MDU3775773.1 cell wall-binding protein [Clostridium perfringens]UBK74484.1 cell wall-binding protein [Clostridium perfringens]HAT4134552.1 cell wall-binding protein [Clostridium perfringens]HAT4144718.1 cell wall-binding protein [Clostridium perfringens]HAT4146825.1 cell wall-binding protein [Clostridium perfringens]
MKKVKEKVAIAVLTGVIMGVSGSFVFSGRNIYASELKSTLSDEQTSQKNEKEKHLELKEEIQSSNKMKEENKDIIKKEEIDKKFDNNEVRENKITTFDIKSNEKSKVEKCHWFKNGTDGDGRTIWSYKNKEGKNVVGLAEINGTKYFFDEYGRMQTGIIKDYKSNKIYYAESNGVLSNYKGWKKIEDEWYYFNGNGTLKTGWLSLGGKRYYLNDQDGNMVIGALAIEGKQYYFNSNGELIKKTGWLKGKNLETGGICWYYFDEEGNLQKGFRNIDGVNYYFTENGFMATGVQNVKQKDGNYKLMLFSENGKFIDKAGWYEVKDSSNDSSWYYINSDYTLATGLKEINNKLYYFDPDSGMMISNKLQEVVMKDGSKKDYYFNNNGVALINNEEWQSQKENNKIMWQYLKNEQPVSGLQEINGKTYYFNENTSYMETGVVDTGKGIYLFDENGAKVNKTGWIQNKGYWYYLNNDSTVKRDWLNSGYSWYYLNDNGIMATQWKKVNDYWYYFGSNGTMQKDWKEINNNWYYLREDGIMATQWEKVNDYWYYFGLNGAMQKDWKEIKNNWYYLRDDGIMATQWEKVNNYWYYFGSNGAMQKDWKEINNNWYYLRDDGIMTTRWNKINDYWYYFNDDGKMINNQYIDGWRIDNNGVAHYEKAFRNPKLENSNQIIVVTTNNMSTSYCNIEIYEKNDSGEWNNIDSTTGRVGANGLAYIENRVQSTNTTPAGVMSITGAFGVKNNPGTKLDYIKVNNNMYWDLNSENSTYNRLINYNPGGDYEHLISYPRQYEYSLITDYNHNQVPNKGGAIFVHCLGRGATGGCVSMPREKMIEILKWIDPKKNPKILVIPKDDLDDYWY